jgi:hypothetical protein
LLSQRELEAALELVRARAAGQAEGGGPGSLGIDLPCVPAQLRKLFIGGVLSFQKIASNFRIARWIARTVSSFSGALELRRGPTSWISH